MDPISMIVMALAAGAAAALKSTAEQAIQDTYLGFKTLIQSRYKQVSIDMLENDPASEDRQKIMREDLEKTTVGSNEEVLRRAQELLAVVKANDPEAAGSVNISLEDLEIGASVNIKDIVATHGDVSIDAKHIKAEGDFTIEDMRSGEDPPKS